MMYSLFLCVLLMKAKLILLTDRERSGGMPLPDLKKQCDISCEKIKTRPVYEAYGEPSCTIDKRRRKMELTQSWSRIKFDILTVIQLISHMTRIFSYLWKKFHELCVQIRIMTLLQIQNLLLCIQKLDHEILKIKYKV